MVGNDVEVEGVVLVSVSVIAVRRPVPLTRNIWVRLLVWLLGVIIRTAQEYQISKDGLGRGWVVVDGKEAAHEQNNLFASCMPQSGVLQL